MIKQMHRGVSCGQRKLYRSKCQFRASAERSVIFKEEIVGGRERVTTDEERVLRGG